MLLHTGATNYFLVQSIEKAADIPTVLIFRGHPVVSESFNDMLAIVDFRKRFMLALDFCRYFNQLATRITYTHHISVVSKCALPVTCTGALITSLCGKMFTKINK